MQNTHNKNTVRYYLLLVSLLTFFFFSNDFGLVDVQKTAIVMAVGIDREEDTYIITSQIAIPQSSKQGKQAESVQIVSRGKTVADAFKQINAKTGWYPKLVFCNLILLGEKSTEQNVFSALEFFIRDEYLSDDCFVATTVGTAKDLLNTSALVDPSSNIAMEKVLSSHAKQVGSVLPATLREFAIGYFGDSRSGYLPILKTEPQQEQIGSDGNKTNSSSNENPADSASDSSSSGNMDSGTANSAGENPSAKNSAQDKPVFSAGETALFVDGKKVGILTGAETFALGAIQNKLRLAPYSVAQGDKTCTLTIRHNTPRFRFQVTDNERAHLNLRLTLSAGTLDYSKALDLEQIKDVGNEIDGVFALAEKKLAAEIDSVFEKCRQTNCDLFGIKEKLLKYEKAHFQALSDTALDGAILDVEVRFRNVR